jgi:hypothetical protein
LQRFSRPRFSELRVVAGQGVAGWRMTRATCRIIAGLALRWGAKMLVMDVDERDAYICELRRGGWSAMEIADEVGLSRSQVHRILAAGADEDDDELARLTRMNSDIDPDDPEGNMVNPPLTFVGIEFEGNPCGVARVMDAAGRHVDELRLYRWKWHYDGDGHDAEREAVLADLDRQIAAQGWRQERDGYGHMAWVQSVRSRWPGHTITGG